jgi:hypothetical protein
VQPDCGEVDAYQGLGTKPMLLAGCGAGRVLVFRCLGVLDVQVCGVRPVGEVAEAAFGQVACLPWPVIPVGDAGVLQAQVCHEWPVIDHSCVGPARSDQFFGSLEVAEGCGGDGHEIAKTAGQQVQLGRVAWPEPSLQRGVDPASYPPHLQEQRKRLAVHRFERQPDHVGA